MRDVFVPTEELRAGWRTTMANLRTWLWVGAISAFVGIVQNAVARGGGWLLSLALQAVQVAVTLAAIRIALRLADGEPLGPLDPKALLGGYFSFLLTTVLVGLIVMAGLILLIVPGVLWLATVGFAPFLCAAHHSDPIESLHESRRITAGHRKSLVVFALLCLGLNIVGALAFGIGLFVTVPTTIVAAVRVMRHLEAAPRAEHKPAVHSGTMRHA